MKRENCSLYGLLALLPVGVQVLVFVWEWAVGVGGAAVETETDVRGEWDGVVGM